jgi:hypothetical protein
MTYSLYTQSFGQSFSNANVLITEVGTGAPAIILTSPTGGVLNSQGQAKLDNLGNLFVYIDNSRTWNVAVFDGITTGPPPEPVKTVFVTPQQITSIAGVQNVVYILNRVPYTRFAADLNGNLQPLNGGTGNVDNFVYDSQHRVTSFLLSGIPYSFSYPDNNTIQVAGDSIATTISFDNSGYIQTVSRTFY